MTRLVMKVIGIADLKSKLSEYLVQVKSGEEITITERGRPVAKIVPVDANDDDLDRLVSEGLVKVGSGLLPEGFIDAEKPKAANGPVTDALIDERRSGR